MTASKAGGSEIWLFIWFGSLVQRCLLELALGLCREGLRSPQGGPLATPGQVLCLITAVSRDFFLCLKPWLVESFPH